MKNNLIYMMAAFLGIFGSCQSPEHVLPTVERQGITSLTAIFVAGKYADKEIVKYIIEDPYAEEYVIPVPWFYPENSDDETAETMTSIRVKAEIANNCKVSPAITILDLTQDNYFTFTEPNGEQRRIRIRGERVKSNKCDIKTFDLLVPEISGIIDNDKQTISLISADDLSAVMADYSLSAHATITPDPKVVPVNLNDPFEFTVTAHDGVTQKKYIAQKEVPGKIPYGFRSGSEKNLFSLDIQTAGFPWLGSNAPSLAVIGNYLVVCMGDGTAPTYMNRITGATLGNITMGSAKASGCVTSDLNNNLLVCTKTAAGQTFTIYKTRSLQTAPVKYLTYTNTTGLDMGTKVSVQGNLDENAQIIATCDGVAGVSGSNKFVRWIVTNGVVGEPQIVEVSGVGVWGAPVSNTKVVASGIEATSPYFVSYYDPNVLYYVDGTTNSAVSTITDSNNGNSWGMNNNCLDARTFNNAQYMTLFCVSHFPHWGMPAALYMYDVANPSNFTGNLNNSPALVFNVSGLTKNTDQEGKAATGDVLLYPSLDGYKMYVYYIDNNCRILGAYEFDCIDK